MASSSSSDINLPSSSSTSVEETLSSDSTYIDKCLADAEELKARATEYFRKKDWSQALDTYKAALDELPKRSQESSEITSGHEGSVEKKIESPFANLRSILNGNIGACYVKLGQHKEAVNACTDALLDNPRYVKALQRRASSNEKIASWSSLTSARDDYNTLLQLLPPDSGEAKQIKGALYVLAPRLEEVQKKETGEMMSKLKDVGNSILGNFGLSTDNFKFIPNGEGGYSMNFER